MPFSSDRFLDQEIGARCLEDLRTIAAKMPQEIYETNPIALYEQMAAGDRFVYCPFAYTYSNYSREGFADHLLGVANPVSLEAGAPLRAVLGGLAWRFLRSARVELALRYALFVAGERCQRTLYGVCRGQPARKTS